jgi:hypothetical protein
MPALRLCDIADDQQLRVACECGRIVLFTRVTGPRFLHVPPETTVAALAPRLRCETCGGKRCFTFTIESALYDEQRSGHGRTLLFK